MDALVYARMLRHRELMQVAPVAQRRVDPWLAGRWRPPGRWRISGRWRLPGRWRLHGLWRLPGRWRLQGLWRPCGPGVVLHRDLLLVPRSAGRWVAVAGSAEHASRCAGFLILRPVWNATVLDGKLAPLECRLAPRCPNSRPPAENDREGG